jgi:uncharacterized phage-associated protein
MPRHTANEVADYLIWRAHEHGSFISNLKLQKLLYYAHAWHLAIYDNGLFSERIEAWVHGPVIPAVYRRFKNYGFRNIDEFIECPPLPNAVLEYLDRLLARYLALDAYALELMTHREDPWIKARGDMPADRSSTTRIADREITVYFRARLAVPEA